LFTGARGTGKTVLLNVLEDVAHEAGWAVVSVTARPGLTDQLTHVLLPSLLNRHDPDATSSRVTSGSVSVLGVGGGITRTVDEAYEFRPDFRFLLERLARVLGDKGGGVFLSLDEVHRGPIDESREVFQAVQHCFRRGLDVAVAAAGLPSGVSDLLNDDVLTFLRRAERHALGFLPEAAVAAALRQQLTEGGRPITPEALAAAVAAVDGYPFLIQLVGFHLWEGAPPDSPIGTAEADAAIASAEADAGRLVYEPLLAGLSRGDLAFLAAMAQDEADPSLAADIRSRLPGGGLSQYRRRLIDAEVIEPAGRGRVRFAIPGLRDYLRAKASRSAT
jgi:hypothetical protein